MALEKIEVKRALRGKFGFVEVPGSKHEAMSLFFEEKKVATARFSRGHRDIHDGILNQIAHAIGVNLGIFKGMVECTVDMEEYIRMLRQRYPYRFE